MKELGEKNYQDEFNKLNIVKQKIILFIFSVFKTISLNASI